MRGLKRTENYPKTLHQGLEVGLQVASKPHVLGHNIGSFTLGAVYNYSRFIFKGGKYDGKYLAGVPQLLHQLARSIINILVVLMVLYH